MLPRHRDVGHHNVISCLAFSPDGSRIISGSWDGTAKIWDVRTSSLVRTYDWGASHVRAVDWSRDGLHVAVAAWPVPTPLDAGDIQRLQYSIRRRHADAGCTCESANQNAPDSQDSGLQEQTRVFDALTGALVHAIEGAGEGVAFSPDGRSMAIVSWASLTILHRSDWHVAARCALTNTALRNVMYSDDGSLLAAVEDAGVFVFDAVTARPGFVATDKHLFHDAPEPNDTLLRVRTPNPPDGLAQNDKMGYMYRFWKRNLSSFRPLVTAGDGTEETRIAFSPTGKLAAVYQEAGFSVALLRLIPGGIVLLDDDTGNTQAFFDSPDQKWLRTIAFAPNGRYMAAAGDDQTIFIWDLETGLGPRCVGSPPPVITSLVYSSDGRTIAAGTKDGTVALVDPSQRTVSHVVTVGESPVVGVDFLPCTELLLTTSQEGFVRLWGLPAMELKLEFRAHEFELVGGAVSADGGHFVSVGYRDPPPVRTSDIGCAEVAVWSLDDGRNLFSLELPECGPIHAVAAAQDRRTLAVSYCRLVIVVDITATPTFRCLLQNPTAEYSQVAFANYDDYLLVTNVGYGMRLVRCGDRTLLPQFSAVHDGPTALAFDLAGTVLARGTAYWSEIEIYEIPAGTVTNCLFGHQNSVTSLSFSLAGTTLVSGSADGTIKFWDARSGALQSSILIPAAEKSPRTH